MRPVFVRTAINFGHLFWTPYAFMAMATVAFAEAIIFCKLLAVSRHSKIFRNMLVAMIIANIASFFTEYYLSVFLNGGYRILVWIPWVKVLQAEERSIYFSSFAVIFAATVLIEFVIVAIVLHSRYAILKLLKAIAFTNLISTALLILLFNGVLFRIMKGFDDGYWLDALPGQEIEIRKLPTGHLTEALILRQSLREPLPPNTD